MTRHLAMVLAGLLLTASLAGADPLPANQLPMFGERAKTPEMQNADAAFIASIQKQGLSQKDAAKQIVRSAWASWAKHDLATAMTRFNQAWLLDPENGNVYHGFELITSARGGTPRDVERYLQLAVSKPDFDSAVLVDYCRFLWTQKQLDRSMRQLDKALQLDPKARNARANIAFVYYLKNDFASACTWAKDAKKNGDALEKGFLEDMCQQTGKQ